MDSPLVRRSFLVKTFVVALATGALLGSAGISFVGFERNEAMVAVDDPEAQLGVAEPSPDGRWVALHVWLGEREEPKAAGTYLIDLASTEPHALPGVVPMPQAWDAVGNLQVLSRRDGAMRTIVPASGEVLVDTGSQEDLLLAQAPSWRPRWCEQSEVEEEDGSLWLDMVWAEEEIEARFPIGEAFHTETTDMEGIVYHSTIEDGSLRIERHDLLTDTLTVTVDHLAAENTSFSASRDGRLLLVVEYTTCRVVDGESGETVGETWNGTWANWLATGESGIFVTDHSGRVELRHIESEHVVALGQSQRNSIWRLALLPDGRVLVHKGHSLDLHDSEGTLITTLFPKQRELL